MQNETIGYMPDIILSQIINAEIWIKKPNLMKAEPTKEDKK